MSLNDLLIRQITATGPISVAEYMTQCLLHPEFGYYATRDPFGAKGDFTTAPEITQMFGEMLGLCLAQTWLDQGAPTQCALVELGPGRGTLMRDMLRTTKSVPNFVPEVHLVEASPTLRAIQKKTIEADIHWHDDVSALPDLPLFLVANEFFDALPIRQYVRQDSGWAERVIGVEKDALIFGLRPADPELDHRLEDTEPGDIVEICAPLPAIVEAVSRQIAQFGGAAIVVDYGDWRSQGNTFQALKEHAYTDPLKDAGNADLTAHVAFEEIAKAATCASTSMTTQGVFLERLGITARAQALAHNMDDFALTSHIAAHRRLTHPEEMGTLFKTIALFNNSFSAPPGFDP